MKRQILLLSTLLMLFFGARARADILYSTFAGTGVFDAGNLIPKGGFDGAVGQAAAVGPQAMDVGAFNSQLFSATASSSANVGAGELKVFASSDGPAVAFANAHFSDVITIVPTAGFQSLFDATFTLKVDGNLTGNADGGGELQVGSTVQSADVGGQALCTAGVSVCSPLASISGGAVVQTLVATIAVNPNSPTVFIQPFLFAAANDINGNFLFSQSGTADFSDTAQLSIQLPDGFTYTSNSGVLLTQVPAASGVPEPSELPVALVMCGALVWLAWRRTSLVPQRDHGIHLAGAPRGQEAGDHGH